MSVWITPTQDIILFFKLNFSNTPSSNIRIKVELASEFNEGLREKKLLPGTRFSALNRKAGFRFTVRRDILGQKKRRKISSLGTFRLFQGDKQIHYENLIGVLAVDSKAYFERIVVPKMLRDMGYITEVIGGKDEPDTIAFHKVINSSEKIDVESTITSDYNVARWDHDCGKFSRYKKKRKLSRLLIITHSQNISRVVLDLLNKTRDPIGLIEFIDLKSIHSNFRKNRDYNSVAMKLSSSGKIGVPNRLTQVKVFIPKQINITRTL